MPNLFDKPIAANPLSSFSALPLQFIDQSLQRKQAQYDKTRSEVEEMEDLFLNTKALPGDQARNKEILQGYEQKIDAIIESSDGDYSQVLAPLTTLKRSIKKDMSYGELGAQKTAYASAMGQQEEYRKLLQQSKIQQSGYDSFVKSVSQHVTSPNDAGGFNRFAGYSPSNVVDPVKFVSNAADEINAKYDEEGQAFISSDNVLTSISNKLQSNPNIMKSVKENFLSTYRGDPKDANTAFKSYYENMIKKVVEEKAYKKYNKVTEGGTGGKKSQTPGFTFKNFQLPNIKGDFEYSGASMARGKDWANKLLGVATTEEFDKSISTPEAKKRIRYMEIKSGEKFPADFYAQQDWLQRNSSTPIVQDVVTRPAYDAELANWVTREGQLKNPTGGMYNQQGQPMSGDEIKDAMGKNDDGTAARALGIVNAGGTYPKGSAIIQGKNGALMIQVPTDTKTLQSKEYAMWQISKVRMTNTGSDVIKLNMPLTSSTGKSIPAGVYQTTHNIQDKTIEQEYPNSVVLSQNGTPKYIVTAQGELKIL